MSIYYIIYHGLIFSGFLLSFVAFKTGHKRYGYLCLLLLLTLLVEMFAEIVSRMNMDFVWSYHVFINMEYTLFILFFLPLLKPQAVRKAVTLSVILFVPVSLSISYVFYHFKTLPALNIDLEGILLSCLSVYLLFNLDIRPDYPIARIPDLWILIGTFTFFGGTFFYNGIYTNLFLKDQQQALALFSIINKPLNLIEYLSINIGLLCLIIKKKYIMQ